MKTSANPLPSRAELLRLFRYDPETGKLFWRYRAPDMFPPGRKESAEWRAAKWNSRCAGKEIVASLSSGHICTSIFGNPVLAHRIIWKLVHDEEPRTIDHINGDPKDNRIENLRSVTQVDNCRNGRMRKTNTSGVTGVRWEARLQKWHARIDVNFRTIHLGVFVNFNEAVAARKAAEIKYGYHANHGQRR